MGSLACICPIDPFCVTHFSSSKAFASCSYSHRSSIASSRHYNKFRATHISCGGGAAASSIFPHNNNLSQCRLQTVSKEPGLHSTSWVQQIATLPLQLGNAYDVLCAIGVMAGAAAWIQLFDFLVNQNFVERKLSRKLIHISTGVLFVLAWPVFSMSPVSRFYAVLVPLVNVVTLLIYGLGVLKDQGLVNSISREGNRSELLRGPLCYVLVLSCCTAFFWRDSPVGMIALAMMCGGDGVADIVGRKFGGLKLPYNHGKSWAGSSAMFLFGFLVSLGFMYYYSVLGFFNLDWERTIFSVAFISLAATVVESLPIASKIDDNLSVPVTAVVLGHDALLHAGDGIARWPFQQPDHSDNG